MQVYVAVLLAVRVGMVLLMPPIGDEAYYWMWGQKLAWSYFDHPPLHAWLLRVMNLVFGWNLFALRALTWFTLAGTLAIFWQWGRRLVPDSPGQFFWPTVAIWLASPLYQLFSLFVFHDHLMMFLCLLSAHFFLLFSERFESGQPANRYLYAGAAALGLAVLTKYNAVLFGIGVGLFFVVRRQLRPALRSPHLWLAALLAIAIQAPVFWWNATEGFASYRFHFSERFEGRAVRFSGFKFYQFVLAVLLALSPFLIPSIAGLMRRRSGLPFADRARPLAITTMLVTLLPFTAAAGFVPISYYFITPALVVVLPLLAGWMRSRIVLGLHFAMGLFAAGVYVMIFLIVPLGTLQGRSDHDFASIHGWNLVADRVTALKQSNDIGFIAAARYTMAAQLGFALGDPDVTAIADRHDQYDYWFDPAAHEGQSALVVSDKVLGLKEIEPYFDSLTPLETLTIAHFGYTLFEPTIYLARGFHAQARATKSP